MGGAQPLPHGGAHAAAADTEVRPDLFSAMLDEHGLTLQDAVDLSRPDQEVDRAAHGGNRLVPHLES